MRFSSLPTPVAVDYWLRYLSGAPEMVLPAVGISGAPHAGSNWPGVTVGVPGELRRGLDGLSRSSGTTLDITLLALFHLLLARYSGLDDVVIVIEDLDAAPARGDRGREVASSGGAMAVRIAVRDEMTGRELLQATHQAFIEGRPQAGTPFRQARLAIEEEGEWGGATPFRATYAMRLGGVGAELSGETPAAARAKLDPGDLVLSVREGAGDTTCALAYNRSRIDRDLAGRLASSYQMLLAGAVDGFESAVGELPMLPERDRLTIAGWNRTAATYPAKATLHGLVEAQVDRTPDAEAVRSSGESVSYAELDSRANRLAHELVACGCGRDRPVGVCMERSTELVVSLLAVLKAGGAYLPLDPDYPPARLAAMLEDAAPAVILVQERLQGRLPRSNATVIAVDPASRGMPARFPASRPPVTVRAVDAAYVIFTSGSSGRPKGVVNEHRGIVNRLLWMQEAFGLEPGERVLQKTPYSFDVSVWEFFWPLIAGATLVVAEPGGHRDPAYLVATIRGEAVTTVHFVPSMLRVFLTTEMERCGSLRRILCSGEALSPDVAAESVTRLPGVKLYNLYGPTEAAVDVTSWEYPAGWQGPSLPIGAPVANTQIHILDRGGHPVPIGVPGELHIGGVQVARGYLGRPELTTVRFIPDPFRAEAGGRLYRTGDRACWRPDGTLEFLGRLDHQVKVRGFRIELGEIEVRLREHDSVADCVVVAPPGQDGEPRLVAYLVYVAGRCASAAELREHLAGTLPDYMLPGPMVELEALPLSPNGKVDRTALPNPFAGGAERPTYAAPQGDIERAIAGLWEEVLGVPRVGRGENFFELGGDSLSAIRVLSRLREEHGLSLPITAAFEAPTPKTLAQWLERESFPAGPVPPPLVSVPRTGSFPLSRAQEQIFVAAQLHAGEPLYNEPFAIHLGASVDPAALERALNELIARHEALRTTYAITDSGPEQTVHPPVTHSLAVLDYRTLPRAEALSRAAQHASAESRTPIALHQVPLLRAHVAVLPDDDWRLYLTVHHLAIDAVAMYHTLVPELRILYEAARSGNRSGLPAPLFHPSDVAAWERSWLSGATLEGRTAFWRRILAGMPVLEVPGPRPGPSDSASAGGMWPVRIAQALTAGLIEVSRRNGVSLFVTLAAAFKVLLGRWSGQDDVGISSVAAGRDQPGAEGVVGCLMTVVVLRTDLSGDPTVRSVMRRVQQVTAEAIAHQPIPGAALAEAGRERSRDAAAPAPAIMFLMEPKQGSSAEEWSVSQTEFYPGCAKLDLALELEERDGEVVGRIEYRRGVLSAITVERLWRQYCAVLTQVAGGAADLPISRLAITVPKSASEIEVYWRHRLGGFRDPVRLEVDRGEMARTGEYATRELAIPEELAGRVEAFAGDWKVTPMAVTHAACAVLLSRYSGRDDVVFGAIAVRRLPGVTEARAWTELADRAVPVRVSVPGDRVVSEWIGEVHHREREAREHAGASVGDLQGWSGAPTGGPLFDTWVVGEDPACDDGWPLFQHEAPWSAAHGVETLRHPPGLILSRSAEGLLQARFDPGRFEREAVERLLGDLHLVFQEMVEAPDRPLARVGLAARDTRSRSRLRDPADRPGAARRRQVDG